MVSLVLRGSPTFRHVRDKPRERGRSHVSGGVVRLQPQGGTHIGGAVSAHGQVDLRWKRGADLLGISQWPRRLSPVTHSHFQALGSAQAPGNSFHLLSSVRPLTLPVLPPPELPVSRQRQPLNPAHSVWLCRWGINPSPTPFPACWSQEGAWLACSTNHCQVSPAHLWGHPPVGFGAPTKHTDSRAPACMSRKGQAKKTCGGVPKQCDLQRGATGVGQDSPFCGRQRSGSALEGKKKRCN